jgi:energy-converting hydrogenase A subunit M
MDKQCKYLLISVDEIHDPIAEELEFSELYELGESLPERERPLIPQSIVRFKLYSLLISYFFKLDEFPIKYQLGFWALLP